MHASVEEAGWFNSTAYKIAFNRVWYNGIIGRFQRFDESSILSTLTMSNSNKLLDLIEEYLEDITANLSGSERRQLYLDLIELLKNMTR